MEHFHEDLGDCPEPEERNNDENWAEYDAWLEEQEMAEEWAEYDAWVNEQEARRAAEADYWDMYDWE